MKAKWRRRREARGSIREKECERERKRVIKSEREMGRERKKERIVWIGKQERNVNQYQIIR